jgi:hypothetical protein
LDYEARLMSSKARLAFLSYFIDNCRIRKVIRIVKHWQSGVIVLIFVVFVPTFVNNQVLEF